MNKKTTFSAVVEFNDGFEDTYDVELDKDICELTYDEVENAICNLVEKEHHYVFTDEDFANPKFKLPYKIVDIVINVDGNSYPVVPEDFDDTELKQSNVYEKYLVLPYARYSLTPECELYMDLISKGLIDKDSSPFDFDTYHSLLKQVKMHNV